MKIIALRPVLYLAHQYKTGDELPVNDQSMIEAWLQAGSAKQVEDDQPEPKKAAKARPAAAQAGVTGTSSDGDPDAMPGRVPKTTGRKKSAK